jgi:hypothetical protein
MRPSNEREWKLEHERVAETVFEGDRVHVRNIRNFSYQSASSFTTAYYDKSFDLNAIESMWFNLSVFDEDRRGPAHSFLSFGFEGGDYLCISVEARQERGESYSVWWGLLRRFEIIYVIGDERDIVGTRAIQRTDQVYMYPIRAPRAKIRALFVEMLEAANGLREKPRFYNTLTASCTTLILDHVNRVRDEDISGGYKILLPGYADELAHDLGLIDTDLDIKGARKRFWINEKARRFADSPDFSSRIRE